MGAVGAVLGGLSALQTLRGQPQQPTVLSRGSGIQVVQPQQDGLQNLLALGNLGLAGSKLFGGEPPPPEFMYDQPFVTGEGFTPVPERRQFGGPVNPRQDFLVGENGPELFRPNVSGQIIPNRGGANATSALQGLLGNPANSNPFNRRDLFFG
jgi:hypothetical protein